MGWFSSEASILPLDSIDLGIRLWKFRNSSRQMVLSWRRKLVI